MKNTKTSYFIEEIGNVGWNLHFTISVSFSPMLGVSSPNNVFYKSVVFLFQVLPLREISHCSALKHKNWKGFSCYRYPYEHGYDFGSFAK